MPASSSSRRTVADPAFDFGSRQSRSGENRRRFAKRTQSFELFRITPIRMVISTHLPPPVMMESTAVPRFKKADRRNSCADFLMIDRIVTPRLADIIEAIERTRDQSDFRLGLLGVRGQSVV
jgi:hypothetical protein